ncbi:Leucine-rich repeat-containing protein 33 [Entamoeba marina]
MKNSTEYDFSKRGYKTIKSLPKDVSSHSSTITMLDLSNNEFSFTKHFKTFNALTVLKANGNKLTELPTVIFEITTLRTVHFSNNEIKEIPNSISALKNIEDLNLSNNKIKSIPLTIESLSRMKVLDLSSNHIDTIPQAMAKLKRVFSLNLSINEFKTFPMSVAQMVSLTNLSVADNKITDVTAAVSELSNLECFNLQNNSITSIPDVIIDKLTKLTSFNINGNPITKLSPLTPMKNLCNFSASLLSGTSGEAIVKSLSSIITLNTLSLCDCTIPSFPSLANLTNLTSLYLKGNTISSVEDINSPCECECPHNSITNFSIGTRVDISSVNLAFNCLKKTPDFSLVRSVKHVDLSFNSLTHVSKKTFHSTIQDLNLAGNPLLKFPINIITCTRLTNLNLSDCHLYELPTHQCSYLCNLKSINLSLNPFTSLTGLTEFKKLEEVILSSNNLITFPTELVTLSHLRKLCVSNNGIKVLTDTLSFLSTLEVVDFSSNKLHSYEPLLNCRHLKEIQLSYNFITELHPTPISLTWKNLDIFNIVGNPIENTNTLSSSTKKLSLVNATLIHKKKNYHLDVSQVVNEKILTKDFQSIILNAEIKTKKGSNKVVIRPQEEPLFDELYEIELGCSQTKGNCDAMEDTFCLARKMFGSAYLVGIFDGHNGVHVSKLCSDQFISIFLKSLNGRIDDVGVVDDCLTSTFSKLNEKSKKLNFLDGSTGLVYFVYNNTIHVANCGDCRAILVKKDSIVQLTNDHKSTNATTKDVIPKECLSGNLKFSETFGVTRTIGDSNQLLLKSAAEVKHISSESDDMFVISCCSNVWDVMSNAEIASIARTFKDSSSASIATMIRDKAITKNSQGNITVTVLDLEVLAKRNQNFN